MKVVRCDICGALLKSPVSSRLAPWEVVTCLSDECEAKAHSKAVENMKTWRPDPLRGLRDLDEE